MIQSSSLSASLKARFISVRFFINDSLFSLYSIVMLSASSYPNLTQSSNPRKTGFPSSKKVAQDDQTVYALTPTVFRKNPRAVFLLQSSSLKEQLLYLKYLDLELSILGSSRIWQKLVSVVSQSGPYVKMFRSEEWPWRSRNKLKRSPCYCLSLIPSSFRATTSGFMISSSLSKARFKSTPRKSQQLSGLLVRKLPKRTPSGLIMGTILTIFLSKNSFIFGELEVRYFKSPLHMQEALVYPGWMRQETKITFLEVCSELAVMVMIGMAKPIRLYVSNSTTTFYFACTSVIYLIMSEQEQEGNKLSSYH